MENLIKNLQDLRARVNATMDILKIQNLRTQSLEMETIMQSKDFWRDQKNAQAVSQKASDIRQEITTWDNLLKKISDLRDLEIGRAHV